MKSATHNLFSFGLILYVASLFGYPLLLTVVLAAAATFFTNALIDAVGHTSVGGIPTRTWVGHSIVTAPLWGALAWAFVLIVPAAFLGVFPPHLVLLGFFTSLGALSGWSHLLVDSLTEGGVFDLDGRRRALAHFDYDNWPLNLGFSLLGVLLLFAALLG
jgi:hypothetical protein